MHNEASRDTLEHEFGTSNDREVIFHILEKGEIQESVVSTNLLSYSVDESCLVNRYLHIPTDSNTQYIAFEDKT